MRQVYGLPGMLHEPAAKANACASGLPGPLLWGQSFCFAAGLLPGAAAGADCQPYFAPVFARLQRSGSQEIVFPFRVE